MKLRQSKSQHLLHHCDQAQQGREAQISLAAEAAEDAEKNKNCCG